MKKSRLLRGVYVLISLLLTTQYACASIVSYQFTGVVDSVDFSNGIGDENIFVGDSYQVTLAWNTTTGGTVFSPEQTHYTAIVSWSMSIGAYGPFTGTGTSASGHQFTHVVTNDGLFQSGLADAVWTNTWVPDDGINFGSATLSQFGAFSLLDSTSSVFTDTSLPSTLSLEDFDTATFRLNVIYGDPITGTGKIEGHLTNIAPASIPSSVPIPAALWLFGSGLLSLVGMARRKKAA